MRSNPGHRPTHRHSFLASAATCRSLTALTIASSRTLANTTPATSTAAITAAAIFS